METKSPTIGAWEPGLRRGPELPSPAAHPARPGRGRGAWASLSRSGQRVRPSSACCGRPHTMGGNVVREPRLLPGHAGGRLPFVREEREERQSSDSLLATAWGPAPVGAHAPPVAGTRRPRGTSAPSAPGAPGTCSGCSLRATSGPRLPACGARGCGRGQLSDATAGETARAGSSPSEPRSPALAVGSSLRMRPESRPRWSEVD